MNSIGIWKSCIMVSVKISGARLFEILFLVLHTPLVNRAQNTRQKLEFLLSGYHCHTITCSKVKTCMSRESMMHKTKHVKRMLSTRSDNKMFVRFKGSEIFTYLLHADDAWSIKLWWLFIHVVLTHFSPIFHSYTPWKS